jgi:hypothetical protein
MSLQRTARSSLGLRTIASEHPINSISETRFIFANMRGLCALFRLHAAHGAFSGSGRCLQHRPRNPQARVISENFEICSHQSIIKLSLSPFI